MFGHHQTNLLTFYLNKLYKTCDGTGLIVDLISKDLTSRKIAVEIKSFLGKSAISEFHTALGQTLNYRFILRKEAPDLILYLAISYEIYTAFFLIPVIQEIIAEHKLKLLIFEVSKEEIVLWKE
ncbi:XisH protein [Cylindrospermum stagnale PCC 7417]|uniref:XisH protein n=1 Tax=Cylindrospermum stagnale PCC 7417 TaxID=56107 RepID=K9X2A5_9NOST|nr:XisH protein [Cylindrospermum stagnale PCC 7417]